MSLLAAVITSQGTGAIATVGLCGGDAADVICKIFQSSRPLKLIEGSILVGNIVDGDEVVDNVVIGCEGKDYFAIHCHGNPLITERVLELLAGQGAEVVSSEKLMAAVLAAKGLSSIGIEVSLAQAQCKTIEGAKLLAYQTKHGIYEFASRIIGGKLHPFAKDAKGCHPDSYAFELTLEQAKDCAHKILKNSAAAKLTIFGCTAVLIGPPNSGKSTLLNCLCGKSKAIVTDIAGTTRDWVTGSCKTPQLFLNLVDTAGLAEELTQISAIEAVSQQKSVEQIGKADIALLLIDPSNYDAAAITALLEKVEIPVVTVLNKSDLYCPSEFFDLPNPISVSAKQGTGITELLELIENVSGVYGLDANSAIAFTERQERLVNEISQCKTLKDAQVAAMELLNGRVFV